MECRWIGDPRAAGHGPDEQELYGVTFRRDHWTPVEGDAALKAASHSHLECRASEEEASAADTPFTRGAKAATEGKKRNVPPAYRGKPEGEAWAAGFDSVAGAAE